MFIQSEALGQVLKSLISPLKKKVCIRKLKKQIAAYDLMSLYTLPLCQNLDIGGYPTQGSEVLRDEY